MTSQGFLGQKKLQKMVVFFFGDFHPMGFPSVKNHQIKTNPSFLEGKPVEGKPVTSYGPRSKKTQPDTASMKSWMVNRDPYNGLL